MEKKMKIIKKIKNEKKKEMMRIMEWMQKVFKVGQLRYSKGMEREVNEGMVVDEEGIKEWMKWMVRSG